MQETEAVLRQFGEDFPGGNGSLLTVAQKLNSNTITLLATVAERLGRRQHDINDLLSIAKSGQELSRKIERLADRLLAEEHEHAQ